MASKLLPRQHTGRIVHHRHTSYFGLFAIIWLAALLLSALSFGAFADDPPPGQGDVGVFAVVSAKQPTVAPTIRQPGSGQGFSTLPVTVSGSCQPGFLVKLFSNDVI